MTWQDDSMRIGDGIYTRWRHRIPGLGTITVEHHDNCSAKAGREFTCSNGWFLKGDVLFQSWGHGERLKAKTLLQAQREAIKKVRAKLEETLHAMEAT